MKKKTFIYILIVGLTGLTFFSFKDAKNEIAQVEIYSLYEIDIKNSNEYSDPFRVVELKIELISPDGGKILHYGFFDGDQQWKILYSSDNQCNWNYKIWFSEKSAEVTGTLKCNPLKKSGRIIKYELNPFWLGKGGEEKTLFRSFHVDDRFFAENWDDP